MQNIFEHIMKKIFFQIDNIWKINKVRDTQVAYAKYGKIRYNIKIDIDFFNFISVSIVLHFIFLMCAIRKCAYWVLKVI